MFVVTTYRHGRRGITIGIGGTIRAQPILSGNIIALLLLAAKSGCLQSQLRVFTRVMLQGHRSEKRLETISFPTVEIDFEMLRVFAGAKSGLTTVRGEFITVVCPVAQEVDLPFGGKLISHVGLQVDELRVILRVGFHRS